MPTKGHLNILLHGLFFMEANGNNLEVYAPPTVSGHNFMGGTRGNITDLNAIPGAIDFTQPSGLLQGKKTADEKDVKPTILQFSRTETVGTFKTKQANRLIVLPWPQQFFSIRLGDLAGFKFDSSGSAKVGTDIVTRCGNAGKNKSIGLVTGLNYFADFPDPLLPGEVPSRNIHFYYDPGTGHDVNAVNADLINAQGIFTASSGFDLQMDKNSTFPVTPLDNPKVLPNTIRGLTPEDGLSLGEPVKTALDQFVTELFENVITLRIDDSKEEQQGFLDRVHRMVNPANCPNMFVLQ